MCFSSRTWTDPQSDRGPGTVQTDDSALRQYTYSLDDVKIMTNLQYPPMADVGEDAPVLLVTGMVFGEAVLMRRSPRRR